MTPSPSRGFLAGCLLMAWILALPLSAEDRRPQAVRTKDTPRSFQPPASKEAWLRRAEDIRDTILVSCGLWPLPERTPLHPIFAQRQEHLDYSVETVALETRPGFYLVGNLYRPRNQGPGPFPGILSPHGHWTHGRLEDQERGSIPARCINFARQGMVAFAYDMVGYNDTVQVDHSFASEPVHQLWGISLMGLQTWNSIRALDFLASLPDVDPLHLGCTGGSGGGTQTFMLGAIDPRLAALAPMVMVSHSMQGGCLCENAPGLRVDYSNIDIAAAAAPTPQLLVAATGDWTKTTPTIEGPALASVYALFNASDHLRYVRYDFPHNYNQTTREEAYRWFGRWLRQDVDAQNLKETSYTKDPDAVLRLWPEGNLPQDAKSEAELVSYLKAQALERLDHLKPTDATALKRFRDIMTPAWRQVLKASPPDHSLRIQVEADQTLDTYRRNEVRLTRPGQEDCVPATLLTPLRDSLRLMAVLVHPEGQAPYLDDQGQPSGLARLMLDQGHAVVLFDAFLTGTRADAETSQARGHFQNFFTTHNRTDLQERVQDVLTVATFAHRHSKGRKVLLIGAGPAGLWAILAGQAADGVIADASHLWITETERLLQQDLFTPGVLRYGGFPAAAALLAPTPLTLHNARTVTPDTWIREAYESAGAGHALQVESEPAEAQTIVREATAIVR